MESTVGALAVKITADTAAFTSQLAAKTTAAGTAAGAGLGKNMVKGFVAVGAGVAIAKFLQGSISAAGAFQQTMNVLQENTQASAMEMESLRELALKMGADTVFSAGEAADAMLELGKAGITPAAIEAGALQAALNLAATEGIDLARSAEITANALAVFDLKASRATEVSDALAGGAAASSAGVLDMAEALSNVGPAAANVSMTVQDTAAALAAFAEAGVKGGEAGTGLKTFLARLVPSTDAAATALSELGVDATKQDGSFRSLIAISGQLEKATKTLTAEERTRYLQAAFGDRASRSALILANQGAEGIRRFTKATSEQGAAQRLADARMKGYAGAVEQFSGSMETLQIALGTALLPAITAVVEGATQMTNWFGENQEVFFTFASLIGGFVVAAIIAYTASMVAAAAATIAATWPVLAVVAAITALVFAIRYAWEHWETFRTITLAVWEVIKSAVATFARVFVAYWSMIWRAVKAWWSFVVVAFNTVRAILAAFANWFVQNVLPIWVKLSTAVRKVWGYVYPVIRMWWKVWTTFMKVLWTVWKFAWDKVWTVIKFVVGLLWPLISGWVKRVIAFWRAGWHVISTVVKFVFGIIVTVIRTAFNVIGTIFDKVRDFVNTVRSAFNAIVTVIGDKLDEAAELVTGIWETITDFFSDAGDWLYDTGAAIIQGLIDGIGSMKDAVLDKAKDVMGPLGWVVPGSPVKEGPLSQHGGYHMRWAGAQIGAQLAEGMLGSRQSVAGAASMLAGSAMPAVPRLRLGADAVAGGDGAVAASEIRVFIGERELTDIVRVETRREGALTGSRYRNRRR